MGTTCSTITVVSGDGCGSLASRCGISASDFYSYNPSPTLCSTLVVGQKVCCTAGGLAVPSQNVDGSCASYLVLAGDSCSAIAASNSITVANLETWNAQTWGWGGCGSLQAGQNICLSTGTPPMPAPVAGTKCGPQVPGTVKPAAGTNLTSLNPCPLNACCDVWGQCGTTADFCTATGTGAPGTARPGTNGCISNCGTQIVRSSPPAQFRRITYFEVFNLDRPCLNMDVSQLDTSQYTHVHFAFLDLTSNFDVDIEQYRVQFIRFTGLTQVKRIVSFGGWTMSTSAATYATFRNAVSAANRDAFASNLANFVTQWNLDGVDIDWEYPGEQDIKDIPADSVDDGSNLAAFLVLLREKLGSSKSLSIAAPASFWYLKGFPIASMADSLDYLVYMTYDLHGQWDYNNTWSDPGCPSPLGNCLRSHVNLTETVNALSMITKASVPSNKVVVGLASYGRSFQMTTPGCTGPTCTFTGPSSGAKPGRCTQTAGYIANAEINEILAGNGGAQVFHDSLSDTDILVYDSVQWVAYMNNETKSERIDLFQRLDMGGVSDWAVDLQEFLEPPTPTVPSSPSAPAESGSFTNPVTANGAINPYLMNCTDMQKSLIDEAWAEAADLAAVHYEWWPGGKWQDAMTLYLGNSTADDYSFWSGKGPIMKNIARQYLLHWGWRVIQPPNFSYAYFYCYENDAPNNPNNDPNFKPLCTDKNGQDTDVTAYTWNDIGTFWKAHYVVLCPQWFSSELSSLAVAVQTAEKDHIMQNTIDYWRLIRARSIFHETYHWEYTVADPFIWDETYDPAEIVQLPLKNQDDAQGNAESWALCAMAIYLQKRFNLGKPPTARPPQFAAVQGSQLHEVYLDSPPAGWKRPVSLNSTTFNPDMTSVTMLEDVGALQWGTYNAGCTDGLYQDQNSCMVFCTDGKCAQSSTNATWICSDCVQQPATPECVAGTYADFDHCWAYCSGGLCSENGDKPGLVQCESCP